MKEYRQPKDSLKKQISLLLPLDIYEGAKRDSQKYNRSMAYHIVETLRVTFDKSIQEVQAEREEAAKMTILERMKQQAEEAGKPEKFLQALEAVFNRFAEKKRAEDFTEAFQEDVITFAAMMLETEDDT
ncbi:hypothetical protein C6502_20520 [Candidatus Poribacteria bacterium]|nr:MAG: hypothetical protein C6502_20520 [Candidatus Poribacteria bacterium]